MGKFLDISNAWSRSSAGDRNAEALQNLRDLLAKSRLHFWTLDSPIVPAPHRFLIAICKADRRCLTLLDAVNEKLEEGEYASGYHVDVFEINEVCHSPEEVQPYFPDINVATISQTPVVGYWKDGVLQESKSGFIARKWVAEAFGFDEAVVSASAIPPRLAARIAESKKQ